VSLAADIVGFLDGFGRQYATLSGRKIGYPDYVRLGLRDEERFVQPRFVPRFLKRFLGFGDGDYTPEQGEDAATPDFRPTDLFADAYVFEAKGSDWTPVAAKRYNSTIIRYARAHNVNYVIVLTPKAIEVFDATGAALPALSVDLLGLYEAAKGHTMLSARDELKHLQAFIDTFSHHNLTPQKKITLLRAAPKWRGDENLRLDDLISNIRRIVELIDVELHQVIDARLSGLPSTTKVAVTKELHSLSLQTLQLGDTFDIKDIIGAVAGSDAARVRTAFIARIAYLTATRLLVLRAWEDAGYIPSTLYDSGLDDALKTAKGVVSKAFDMALGRGRRAYKWLFEMDGPYSWFVPSDDALSDALYLLAPFNMSKIDSDVLGHVYESLIDINDRKNKGQYYTRRDIINFIIDLTGFVPSGARHALDMACGSGGFLVDLTRRYRDRKVDFAATMSALVGVEISDFPQFVSQANLLLQSASSVRLGKSEFPNILPIIEADALGLFTSRKSVAGVPIHKAGYVKSIAHRRFDLIATNPPYIGQQGHSELFQRTMAMSPTLKQYSESKMDYFYYFISVGLDLLNDQGALAFITTNYWPMNDGASKLRAKVLSDSCIECFVDFGETKLFPDALGQHNAVFVLRRERDAKRRAANVPYVVKVTDPIPNADIPSVLDRIRRAVRSGKPVSEPTFWGRPSVLAQRDLSDAPWRLFQPAKSRRAGLTERTLGGKTGLCDIAQGVVPGVQTIGENIAVIPHAIITRFNIVPSTGVFVLTPNEVRALGKLNAREQSLLKPFYKNSDVDSLTMDGKTTDARLLYIDRKESAATIPHFVKYLERFKPYLESRREVRNGTMEWYGLHWPRTREVFESKKLVWAYRAGEAMRFAISTEVCYGSTDMYFLRPLSRDASVEFLFLYLNSELVRKFLRDNGKKKGTANEVFSSAVKPLTVPIEWQNDADVKRMMRAVERALKGKSIAKRLADILDEFDRVVAKKFSAYEPTLERIA
jgi:hypothetical protein